MVHKELFPGTYAFRITWEGATVTEANVDIEQDSPLLFQTAHAVISLVDANGLGLPGGIVTFFSDAWRDGGTTADDGQVELELLPKDYLFNMEYAGNTMVKASGLTASGTAVEFEWDGEALKSSGKLEKEPVQHFNIFPNPAGEVVNIEFFLETEGPVEIEIVDLTGKMIRKIYDKWTLEGSHRLQCHAWVPGAARDQNGVYLCRITAGDRVSVKRLILR